MYMFFFCCFFVGVKLGPNRSELHVRPYADYIIQVCVRYGAPSALLLPCASRVLQRHALSDLSPAVRHRNAVSEGRSIFYGGGSHLVL